MALALAFCLSNVLKNFNLLLSLHGWFSMLAYESLPQTGMVNNMMFTNMDQTQRITVQPSVFACNTVASLFLSIRFTGPLML